MNLRGAVAVLTGAGRLNGVGAALAKLLAKEGCNVLEETWGVCLFNALRITSVY